ncbi:S1C family serine protease [Paenisporosarcina sp. NPDC076898]|uniref:S1C family serine protease n=1 Tax=unclassified Paenisporosarcina TaxID=2642018 RepID=UPI003D08FA6F
MSIRWLVSSVVTLALLSVSTFGYWYIDKMVPRQLTAASAFKSANGVAEGDVEFVSTDLKGIIQRSQKLVVKIELDDGSLGSGFLYNKKGDVITNAHVVSNTKQVKVITEDEREFEGTVIGISEDTDVALVRVPGLSTTAPMIIDKEGKAEIGDEVLALGTPLGLQNTVTTGIISGVDRDFDLEPFHYVDVYQISAPIAPGNSGGPLIDKKTGKVIGINSAGMDQGTIGFSIPIASVYSLIENWSSTPLENLPEIAAEENESESEEESYSEEDIASELVIAFYDCIESGDFVEAYSLLGSNWQSKTSYEEFRDGYLYTKAVAIDELLTDSNGDEVSVMIFITAEELKNDGSTYSKYKLEYEVGDENGQMKLLSGKGEKIE